MENSGSTYFVTEVSGLGDEADAEQINERLVTAAADPVTISDSRLRDGTYRVWFTAGEPGAAQGEDALSWTAEAAGVSRDRVELIETRPVGQGN